MLKYEKKNGEEYDEPDCLKGYASIFRLFSLRGRIFQVNINRDNEFQKVWQCFSYYCMLNLFIYFSYYVEDFIQCFSCQFHENLMASSCCLRCA